MNIALKILVVCSSVSLVSGFVTFQAFGGTAGISSRIGTYEAQLPMCAAPVGRATFMEIDAGDTLRLDDAQPAETGSRFEVNQELNELSTADVARLYAASGNAE